MALIGGALGLPAAVAVGRTAEALLFGLSGHDPWVLAGSVALLSAVMFGAGYPASTTRLEYRADGSAALRVKKRSYQQL